MNSKFTVVFVQAVVVTMVLSAATGSAVSTAAEEGEWIDLFNGKDLTGWRFQEPAADSHWVVGKGVDIYTERKFTDAVVELEVMVAKGSNSGIYLMGEYEIQVMDSFGEAPAPKGMGGILTGVGFDGQWLRGVPLG